MSQNLNKPVGEAGRFFGRLSTFDCECPYCGRLLQVGSGKPDNECYNRLTSVVTCRTKGWDHTHRTARACGRRFLVGIIAWPIAYGRQRHGAEARPPDQRPNPHQLTELRQHARAMWMSRRKRTGDALNQIEPEITLDHSGESPKRYRLRSKRYLKAADAADKGHASTEGGESCP